MFKFVLQVSSLVLCVARGIFNTSAVAAISESPSDIGRSCRSPIAIFNSSGPGNKIFRDEKIVSSAAFSRDRILGYPNVSTMLDNRHRKIVIYKPIYKFRIPP